MVIADNMALITSSEDEMQGMVEDTGESAKKDSMLSI